MSKSKRNFSRFLPFAFSDRSVPAATCRRPARAWRGFEALEDRRLLAADIQFTPNLVSSDGEGGATASAPSITVSGDLTGKSAPLRTIFLSTTDGAAKLGEDYSVSAIILPAIDYGMGVTFKLTDVAASGGSGGLVIINDNKIEGDESFQYTLSESSTELKINGLDFNPVTGTHTIEDNDTAKFRIVPNSTVNEAGGAQTVSIELVTSAGAQLAGDVTVTVTDLLSGTALTGADYKTFSKADLTFSAGSTNGATKTITVTPENDRLIEGNQTIQFDLAVDPGDPTVNVTAEDGAVTIVDDDKATISFSKSADSVVEPGGSTDVKVDVTMVFTSTGEGPEELESGSVTVHIDVNAVGTTAEASDYTLSPAAKVPIVFTNAVKSTTATITVNGDILVEGNEIVDLDLVVLSGAGTLGVSDFKLTIIDDDSATLSVSSPATFNEGSGSLKYTVALSQPADEDIVVNIGFSGTATLGQDYTDPGVSKVTIKAGNTSATVDVAVTNDILVEPDETLNALISDPGKTGITLVTNFTSTKIVDNDTSTVAILGPGTIGEASGKTTYTLVMSQPSSTATTVLFSIDGASTAVSGSDFNVKTGSPIVFAAGEQIKTIEVDIIDDALAEPTETAILKIDSVVSTGGLKVSKDAADKATASIVDNDQAKISIADVTVLEGTGGSKNAILTISLAGTLTSPVTVDYATIAGTATEGADYTKTTGKATLPANVLNATTTISIPIVTDSDAEGDEQFKVKLSNIVGIAAFTDDEAVVTIDDDDFGLLSISSVAGTEGGNAKIVLTRTGSTSVAFTATISTSDGSAIAGSDYTAVTNLVVPFAAGETVKEVLVSTIPNDVVEGPETFTAKIVSISNVNVSIVNDTTSVTINDDDSALINVSADATEAEGNTGDANPQTRIVTFETKGGVTAQGAIVITYATEEGTAKNSDYTQVTGGTVTIPAGQTSTTAAITITRDNIVELDETFKVKITNISAAGNVTANTGENKHEAVITIEDDDTATLKIGDLTVIEGTAGSPTTAKVIVTLTGDVQEQFKLNVSATGGAGDQTTAAGEVTFPTGSKTGATQEFTVSIVADDIVEPSETFNVNIDVIQGLGATVGDGLGKAVNSSGTVTITDDDAASISVADLSADEDDGTQHVVVTLTGKVQEAFTFKVKSSNGTATTGDSDYTAVDVVASFPAGSISGATTTVPVAFLADGKIEANETFNITLSDITPAPAALGNVTIGDGTAVITILNDDSQSVSISKVQDGAENAPTSTNGKFKVSLNQPADGVTIVTLAVSGSANAGVDYKAISNVLQFNKGEQEKFIDIEVLNDIIDEGAGESVRLDIVSISGPGAPTIGMKFFDTITIVDDDITVTDVKVKGAGWAAPAYSLLKGSLHDNNNPNSTLSWVNLDTIEVVFNEDPVGDDLAHLGATTMTLNGINKASYALTFVGYDDPTNTATWKLASGTLGADRYSMTLNGDGSEANGVALNNGDYSRAFNVLPGDTDGNGFVALPDRTVVTNNLGSAVVNSRADLDGNGFIALPDRTAVTNRLGTTLPTPPPALAAVMMAFDDGGAFDDANSDAVDAVFEFGFEEDLLVV